MASATARVKEYPYAKEKEALLARMRKIEGQARGIQRMMEENRYCVDVVQQLTALSAAVDEVALILLQGHIKGCVADAIREGGGQHHIDELMQVLRKGMRR